MSPIWCGGRELGSPSLWRTLREETLNLSSFHPFQPLLFPAFNRLGRYWRGALCLYYLRRGRFASRLHSTYNPPSSSFCRRWI